MCRLSACAVRVKILEEGAGTDMNFDATSQKFFGLADSFCHAALMLHAKKFH